MFARFIMKLLYCVHLNLFVAVETRHESVASTIKASLTSSPIEAGQTSAATPDVLSCNTPSFTDAKLEAPQVTGDST